MHDPYLKWSQLACIICMVYEQPTIDGRSVATVTNKNQGAMYASTCTVSATVANAAHRQ